MLLSPVPLLVRINFVLRSISVPIFLPLGQVFRHRFMPSFYRFRFGSVMIARFRELAVAAAEPGIETLGH